jgi:hypothetical protein
MRFLLPMIVCSLCCLLLSCRQQRYVYAASKINTPALEKKGDSRLNASFSFGNAKGTGTGDSSSNLGFDVQGAYAVSNHFALMGSFYLRREADLLNAGFYQDIDFDESYIRYRRHLLEGGIGYFTKVGKQTTFSVYGGAAFGKLSWNDKGFIDSNIYSRFFRANVSKFFLQPGLTAFNRKNGSFDLSFRVTLLHAKTTGTDYNTDELEYFRLQPAGGSLTRLLLEQSCNFQFALFGSDWLKLETGLSFAQGGYQMDTRRWNLSLGLTADLFKALR